MVLHGTQIPPFIGRLTSSVPRPSEGAPASQGIGPRGRYTRVVALYHFSVDALYRCGREAGPAVSLDVIWDNRQRNFPARPAEPGDLGCCARRWRRKHHPAVLALEQRGISRIRADRDWDLAEPGQQRGDAARRGARRQAARRHPPGWPL